MGNNRFNQQGVKIPDYTPREERKKDEASAKQLEPTVVLLPCCVCNKTIKTGYYGRHENGGTCSKKCEDSFKQGDNHENATCCTSFNGAVYSPR